MNMGTKEIGRRVEKLEGANPDEVFILRGHDGKIWFEGTQADLAELMREVSRRGRPPGR